MRMTKGFDREDQIGPGKLWRDGLETALGETQIGQIARLRGGFFNVMRQQVERIDSQMRKFARQRQRVEARAAAKLQHPQALPLAALRITARAARAAPRPQRANAYRTRPDRTGHPY